VRKDQVRIPRPKVGERLAQQGILQTQGAGIFALCANTLVPLRHYQILTWFFAHAVRKDQVRIPRPKVGERLAQQGILQTQGVGIFALRANTLVPQRHYLTTSLHKISLSKNFPPLC